MEETNGPFGSFGQIAEGQIDSTFLISHRMPLDDGPEGYRKFHDEQDTYTKIVLKPGRTAAALAA